MMVMTSAFMVKTTPSLAEKVWNIDTMTPPQAASAVPWPKPIAANRRTSSPTSPADCGETATARKERPQRLNCRNR
ncbi:hypothetical protein D3C76_1828670 [compost metagenome]